MNAAERIQNVKWLYESAMVDRRLAELYERTADGVATNRDMLEITRLVEVSDIYESLIGHLYEDEDGEA